MVMPPSSVSVPSTERVSQNNSAGSSVKSDAAVDEGKSVSSAGASTAVMGGTEKPDQTLMVDNDAPDADA